ncbi:hypothetical protein ABUW04_12555 [Streptacidiphilus sp. N1-10]|uniref:PKD domain-containing protein n=1 Tax=Streptacidiphilus jeojiensis TaxID=3229225 RepID=A0ABV6XLJ1_9ACTN
MSKLVVQKVPLTTTSVEGLSGFSHPVFSSRAAGVKAAASTLSFTPTRTPGKGAYDVEYSIDVTGSTGAVTLTASWDGVKATPITASGDGAVAIGHTFTTVGEHTLSVSVTDQTGTFTNGTPVYPDGSDYTAYGPTRLLDTRVSKTTLKPNTTVKVKVGGNGGISADAIAAILNLTVTNATGGGYITAYPDGSGRPPSSNVNFAAKQTVANLSFVPVGSGGYVDLYNGSKGTVDVIADIDGYFSQTAASGYTPVGPTRLVDTRKGTGATKAQIPAKGSIAVQIAGKAGVPSGVTAVALNVTATNDKSGGYLTTYPDGSTPPTASNVNFSANETVANAVVVPVGADGKIRIANGPGLGVDAVVDVAGYYSAGSTSAFLPTDPTRVEDSRTDKQPMAAYGGIGLQLEKNGTEALPTALVYNATVPVATGPGYLAVTPEPTTAPTSLPSVSTLNFVKNQTVPNLVQATPGATTGAIDFWNVSATPNHLVVDLFGYYLNY